MIGEMQSEYLMWVKKGDSVEIRRRDNNELIQTENVDEMIDYAFRHTDYSNMHTCDVCGESWNEDPVNEVDEVQKNCPNGCGCTDEKH